MMIFDSFETAAMAHQFAEHIRTEYPDRIVKEFATGRDSQTSDPFPFELNGPVVHVSRKFDYLTFPHSSEEAMRAEIAVEQRIQRIAPQYGGDFAGT